MHWWQTPVRTRRDVCSSAPWMAALTKETSLLILFLNVHSVSTDLQQQSSGTAPRVCSCYRGCWGLVFRCLLHVSDATLTAQPPSSLHWPDQSLCRPLLDGVAWSLVRTWMLTPWWIVMIFGPASRSKRSHLYFFPKGWMLVCWTLIKGRVKKRSHTCRRNSSWWSRALMRLLMKRFSHGAKEHLVCLLDEVCISHTHRWWPKQPVIW